MEQVIDLKGNIRVFCKVRPKINRKLTANDNHNPELMATTCLNDETIAINDDNNNNKKQFVFDQIYETTTPQDVLFEDVKPLIDSCINGYNVCIFAYGQTGSGKTYTMEGTVDKPGIIYNTFDYLFNVKHSNNNNNHININDKFKVYISCLEIYNEKIKDLLVANNKINNNNNIQLKPKLSKCAKKVLVPGLTKQEVLNTENVRKTLRNAYKNRSTGITNMNEHSSRSHALIFIDIIKEKTNQISRLVLIDLAGSERVKKSGVTGAAFDEARNINKSLSALGNVINSLQTKQQHIPFRDSQLTYLLYDCLGHKSSKALMFCNISCELNDVKESLNTLQFANRVRRVELGEAIKTGDNDNDDNNNNNNNESSNMLKQKLKKLKKDLQDKDKEINNLKMNNRNYKKEISKLTSSIDNQANKNSNNHQTRMELNNLQKEHSRAIMDNDKKDKMIKKLQSAVNDYKHKLKNMNMIRPNTSRVTISRPNLPRSNITRPRTANLPINQGNKGSKGIKTNQSKNKAKNSRKRKLPNQDEKQNAMIDNDKNHNGPAQKRRKLNTTTNNIPSYQQPTRNSRDKKRTMMNNKRNRKSNVLSESRSRSISFDSNIKNKNRNKNKPKNNKNNENMNENNHNVSNKNKSQIRTKRTSSLDSIVVKDITNKQQKFVPSKAPIPLTPSSAMNAISASNANKDNQSNHQHQNILSEKEIAKKRTRQKIQ